MNKKTIITLLGIISTMAGTIYALLVGKIQQNFEMIQALIEVHIAN